MRAYDCTDPEHGDMHMTGADDAELTRQLQAHRDEYHQEMSDDEIQRMVSQAYEE